MCYYENSNEIKIVNNAFNAAINNLIVYLKIIT